MNKALLSELTNLPPKNVWTHFATLCAVPRQSKKEEAIVRVLQTWAETKKLENLVDNAGNLIIRKPASKGYENAKGIILQSHLDMVCQKNQATEHNFDRDPINPIVKDGYVVAEDTTLGADNGIGVALILSVLEDESLAHGPIEALLTVDEEDGMGGAKLLKSNVLKGDILINLDSEEWGKFCIGCAGGVDVYIERKSNPETAPKDWKAYRISVTGLRGGHSGININENRGNAIKLMARFLREAASRLPIRLSEFVGGTARNALPREAEAVISVEDKNIEALEKLVQTWHDKYREELRKVDANVALSLKATEAKEVLSLLEQNLWLSWTNAAPHGVKRMSVTMADVVETSNNFGMIELRANGGTCNFMPRSIRSSACIALADEIISLFSMEGTTTKTDGFYPSWNPKPESQLLKKCMEIFRREFGKDAQTEVIHAGLECGIFGEKYPNLELISFGPNIRNPHAPGESVEIESVAKCWQFLTALLKELN